VYNKLGYASNNFSAHEYLFFLFEIDDPEPKNTVLRLAKIFNSAIIKNKKINTFLYVGVIMVSRVTIFSLLFFSIKADFIQLFPLWLKNPSSNSCIKKAIYATPTDGHLYLNYQSITQQFWTKKAYFFYGSITTLIDIPNILNFLVDVYQKEVEENLKGRYTFFHAQKWQWEWYAELYKILYEATQKTTIKNYQFIRFNRVKPPKLEKEEEIYTTLRTYGRIYNGTNIRRRLLFLNGPIFGNTTQLGSCTIDFWRRNDDASNLRHNTYKINNEYIFNKFNLGQLYKKYEKKLSQIQHEHTLLSNQGNLLLFSLSKNYINENVYMAQCPGLKHMALINGQLNDDVILFLETLKNNPDQLNNTDLVEFCLILTKHKTLKPSEDCKIFAFNNISDDSWNKFTEKRNRLFSKIKKDITG